MSAGWFRKAPAIDEVQTAELEQRLGRSGSLVVVDVREPGEVCQGRIPGCKHIPLGQLLSRLNELNPEEEIYLVCRSGSRSGLAAAWLKQRGYQKVFNVKGGMIAWHGPVE